MARGSAWGRPNAVQSGIVSLPRWARAGLGIAAIALGAALFVRPTTSLGLLALLIGAGLVLSGVLAFMGAGGSDASARNRPLRLAAAALWLLAGVFVLAYPGLTVRAVALAVGIALVVNGAVAVFGAWRSEPTLDGRIAAVALGLAAVVFGVLAILWPDITLLAVGVAFGAWLVVTGALEVWHALRGSPRARRGPATAVRRWARTIGAVAVLAIALGAGALSAAIHDGSPVVDDFYAAPRYAPAEPGRLIRSEPFTRDVPSDARAWRILYSTTRGDGSSAVASGIVVVPRTGDGEWPVISWTHGTTGYGENCAPSLATHPFESGAFFLIDSVIDNGWALVATDYIGLGTEGPHPYLIGADAAHAALDAARAARELTGADLGEQNVVWGHSQGGGAALWTGALAETYAPDVHLAGVAALAPASDLAGLVSGLPDITGGSVFASYVVEAYTSVYDDVTYRDYIRPGAQTTVREMAKRCLAEPGVLVTVLELLALSEDPEIFATDPTTGPLGARLTENTPPPTIGAPLLIGQGGADQLIAPAMQGAYVDRLCAAGQQVDYRVYEGRDHVPLVEPDSPLVLELLQWTFDTLEGVPVAQACVRSGG